MKPLLILAMLISSLFITSVANAEWTKVVKGKNNGATIYIDFDRIRKTGIKTYFWKLVDMPKPGQIDNISFSSSKEYVEAECGSFRSKYLIAYAYPTQMGYGTPNFTFKDGDWSYPNPGSIYEDFLKAVCNH
ncbi:hypothetical protein OAN59_11930 [Alphaproteobacteria bacterium]|nr:hypothetical protein [Alphaproteobacteria bacterium]